MDDVLKEYINRQMRFLKHLLAGSRTLATYGCDGLPLGMLYVGDGITDDVVKEYLPWTLSTT